MNAIGEKYYYYSVVFATVIPSLYYIIFPGKITGTIISAIAILGLLVDRFNTKNINDLSNNKIVKLWIVVMFIGIVNSLWTHNYDDDLLKDCVLSLLSIINVFLILTVTNIKVLKSYFVSIVYCYGIVAVISYLIWHSFQFYDVPHLIMPVTMLYSLFPFINKKNKIIILIICLLGMYSDISVRSCLLEYLLTFFIVLLLIFISNDNFVKISKWLGCAFLITPIICLSLAFTESYNVLEKLSEIQLDSSLGANKGRDDFMIDTRTGIYEDVANSTDNIYNIILGQGIGTRIQTSNFTRMTDEGTFGRKNVEVGILNVYVQYGLIGVFVVLFMFFSFYYNSMFKSNNLLSKIMALYIAIRFVIFFVETPSITSDLYIALGICISPQIRVMSNEDLKAYFQNFKLSK